MASPLSGLRVLLVEDETLVAMLTESMLEDLGCELAGLACGLEEALDLAETERFDLALLDVNLGGRQVFPVADLLAQRGTPFVFTTGYGVSGLREDLRDRPSLAKPFRRDELRDVLVGALETAS